MGEKWASDRQGGMKDKLEVFLVFFVFYVCLRIMEQHSREVSEMDNLLQEELQLVKDSHLQNVRIVVLSLSPSLTHSHYLSLSLTFTISLSRSFFPNTLLLRCVGYVPVGNHSDMKSDPIMDFYLQA